MTSPSILIMSPEAPAAATPDRVMARLAGTTRREGLEPLAARLSDLGEWLGDDLSSLSAAIAALSGAPRDVAERSARHLLDRPGKRLRAICVLIAARFGARAPGPRLIDLAIAAELVHAATLLHDDVIDEGTERRGAAAARVIFGNSASILGGDHLLIEALRRVQGFGDASLLVELLDVIGEMIAAEAIQLERRGRRTLVLEASPEQRFGVYLDVVRGKTAALFRWSLRAGARASGLESAAIGALGRAGEALGFAFQLIDDVIDLEGDAAVIGKDSLADLREGKLTWPILVAIERDPGLAAKLEHVESAAKLAGLVPQIRATDCAAATRQEAQRWGAIALDELRRLPPSRARMSFEALISGALERTS